MGLRFFLAGEVAVMMDSQSFNDSSTSLIGSLSLIMSSR